MGLEKRVGLAQGNNMIKFRKYINNNLEIMKNLIKLSILKDYQQKYKEH